MSHRVALGTDARGNITRLDNALSGIPERLERANEQLTNLYNQQEAAKAELGKPFPQEAELVAKSQRLAGMGLAAILIIFLLVWAVVKLETLGNHIKEFICY